MSGYDLISELNALTEGTWRPASGSIYPILQSLRKEKLIEVVSRENRSKQIYSITTNGKRYLQTQSNLLSEFAIKWSKIRLALIDLVSPENLSTLVMETTKANRVIWQKIIEKKTSSTTDTVFSMKEYKLLLESELAWLEREIRQLA
jgi:DNA-binding PadR family transcriptional regulator